MARIYIAGKMQGLRNLGYTKFYNKAKELEAKGWETVNPAAFPYEGVEVSVTDTGVVKTVIEDTINDFTYHKVLYRDFMLIDQCAAIYMMTGWEMSSGASCELAYAKLQNKEIIYETKGDGYKARTFPYKLD